MISVGALDTLSRAQGLLDSSARKIAQGPPQPEDMVNLLQAREQFSAGTKVIKTEDEMNRKLLDILA